MVIVAALSVILLRIPLWPWEQVPDPGVHDEFSYLLAADTFASGRLSNPPHPMWVHFETFHVNAAPFYVSVYPPAQGLVLALGKRLAGAPWAGVLLSCAAMAATVCWALRAWLPPPWPLLGGILIAIRLCTFSYWINSYWGGAVAAIGGAFVLGSLPRAMRRPRPAHGFLLGLGVVILASSRPYEGFAFCVPFAVTVAIRTLRIRATDARDWRRLVLLPASLCVALGGIGGAYYCLRTTGHALLMPHQVNQHMYAMARPFIWQTPDSVPNYRHKSMQALYERFRITYARTRTFTGFVLQTCKKAFRFWLFFVGPVFSIPLVVAPFTWRRRRTRLLLCSLAAVLVAITVEVYFLPHYAAPATAALYGILLQSMRYMQPWRIRGKRAGLLIARTLPLICAAMLMVRVLGATLGFSFRAEWPETWYYTTPGMRARADLLRSLQSSGERHLVLVRYGENHIPDDEWVYNEADLDGAPVIWARDMGTSANRELVRYFSGRQIWILEPDHLPATLRKYTDASDTAEPTNAVSIRLKPASAASR